jgi:hypothetical protein
VEDHAPKNAIAGTPAFATRDVLFISKATPGDDEFALWLGPRLEAEGYRVFADILKLEPGTRWRQEITATLQDKSIKMLLCCRDSTLARDNVQEEVGIGLDLAKQLPDPKFIIPLRIEPYKKVLGIGEILYIDFTRGWAEGLIKLLATLKRQGIKPDPAHIQINPAWESFRRRGAIEIKNEPERLTSNWLGVMEVPDLIRYFVPTGATSRFALTDACQASRYPAVTRNDGFFSFATTEEINELFGDVGKFTPRYEGALTNFISGGAAELDLQSKDASNIANSMFRKAWDEYCKERGLLEHRYSAHNGFHASKDQVKIGQKIAWGRQGDRRASMLRNVAKNHVWQFGVSALPAFWPFYHLKLKSRVLFSPLLTTRRKQTSPSTM